MPAPMPGSAASSPRSSQPLRVLLVAHTHWDREWYHPAGRFRQRLVALVDGLLDEAKSECPDLSPSSPFLLDGQAIVLQDYLSVRPEREAELRQLLQSGAVEAGPWFVLADNLIPSGEAILRNLEAGRRVLARFGAAAPAVAYCPDSFGHPAALPDIAAGYGFEVAVLWRGYGGSSHPAVDTVWWEGVSGTRTLLHHLPPDGYETGSSLPVDAQDAARRWTALAALLGARNRIGVTLLPSGADHHARQTDLAAAVAAAREAAGEMQRDASPSSSAVRIERTSLADAAAQLLRAATLHEASDAPLPVVKGELRNSYGYTWALQGTFATRAHEKRRNAMLERALCRDAEPWLALAYLHGHHGEPRDGSIGLRLLAPLLAAAWETLLTTHPHDTLCGCSVDDVARAMEAAQDSVHAQQAGLHDAALALALRHDLVEARRRGPDDRLVVVRNRAGRARGGVAELRLRSTVGDVPVGPGSAGAVPVPEAGQSSDPSNARLDAPQQLLRSRLAHHRRESPQHYPDDDIVREEHIVAWVPPVPAHGLRVMECAVHDIDAHAAHVARSAPGTASERRSPGAAPQPVKVAENADEVRIDNGHVALSVNARGVSIRQGERLLPDALSVETVQDWGDSYTQSLRGAPVALSLERFRVVHRGPLRASVELDWRRVEHSRVRAPSDVERHQSDPPVRRRKASVQVRTTLIVDAEARHVRCDVRVCNRMHDHRLQLVWHTDVRGDATARADAAFGDVQRVRVEAPSESAETPPSTMPLHRWVSCSDERVGAALLSDGLAESEAGGGRLAVTLVRAIGELSRGDLPERPGHAGWPCRIPLAQCQGVFRARLGLLLHSAWSDETLAEVENVADDLLLPLVGESWRDLARGGRLLEGPALTGFGLRASAVTLARDGNALLLRARNFTERVCSGTWTLPGNDMWFVTECRLDETPVRDTYESSSRVQFSVAPRALSTLRIARVAG